jgi:nicotinamidase-related amidase
MNWKTAYRSFYYEDAPEPEVPSLPFAETALLCIDVQNYGLAPKQTDAENARWAPFYARMRETVIPNLRALQDAFRNNGMDVVHARIAAPARRSAVSHRACDRRNTAGNLRPGP